jgi:hypothetical protein
MWLFRRQVDFAAGEVRLDAGTTNHGLRLQPLQGSLDQRLHHLAAG